MPEPLYNKIADRIRAAIIDGEYGVEDLIPSENELAQAYATSRITIRKSLDVLENEGLIKAVRGKGYFVQSPAYTVYTLRFDEDIEKNAVRYQKMAIVLAEGAVAEALNLDEGRYVVETHRLIRKAGMPAAYDEKFIPYTRGSPSVEMEINFAEFPQMFADRFSPVSIWTKMELGVETAPDYVCKSLGCRKDSTLMVVYRYIYNRDNTVIGYGRRFLGPKHGRLVAESGYYTAYSPRRK